MTKQLYKFRRQVEAGDKYLIFELVEERGKNGLFRTTNLGTVIQPTAVYPLEDMIKI